MMVPLSLLLGASILTASGDSLRAPVTIDTTEARAPVVITSSDSILARFAPPPRVESSTADTVRRRPRAVEVSDAYALRLRIHYLASFAVIPLFAMQTIAGNQLYQNGGSNPSWASNLHQLGAAGLGTVFAVNTVTGGWNLWDSRSVSEGRTLRLIHSGLMLASDAGFTYAGVKLGPEAKRSASARIQHRRYAYISMGTALVGYATMLFGHH
jgi:hypothetical protein